jgi:hypothetical protein
MLLRRLSAREPTSELVYIRLGETGPLGGTPMKEEFTGKDAEALSFIRWEIWICVAVLPLASGRQQFPRHGCKSGPS